jgi:hypothetical protein
MSPAAVQVNHKQQLKNELCEWSIGRNKPTSLRKCQKRLMNIVSSIDQDINAEEFTDYLIELVNYPRITTQDISIAVEGMLQDWGIEEIEYELNN